MEKGKRYALLKERGGFSFDPIEDPESDWVYDPIKPKNEVDYLFDVKRLMFLELIEDKRDDLCVEYRNGVFDSIRVVNRRIIQIRNKGKNVR